MHRATLVVFLLSTILLATATLLGIAQANPYGVVLPTETSPPADVNLDVTVQSPVENATYANGTVPVCFNVTLNVPPKKSASLFMAFYRGDWMQAKKWCPFMTESNVWVTSHFLKFNFDITNVPAGRHSLDITPTAAGTYAENGKPYTFQLNKTVTINFWVQPQTTSPSASIPTADPTALASTQTPIQTPLNNEPLGLVLYQQTLIAVASMLIIAAVASVALVYTKKRKSKTT
jgi:hypothetical protein